MSSGGTFSFESAYIGAIVITHTVTAKGYLAGKLIYSQDFVAVNAQPELFTFNFNGIDTLVIDPNGSHITIDDMTVSAVPEPSTIISGALLLLSFAGSAIQKLRKA